MTALAPTIEAFFTQRLAVQRDASPHTIAAYRDTFRLLLRFAQDQTGKQPFQLDLDDLDAPLIGAFVTHLEQVRGNNPRTRNAGLGAIHSFYRYAALEHPEHAHTIARVMAIPTKRHQRNTVSYLDTGEITALLAAPDRRTWLGRRDHALLVLMIQTGIRVSELTGLRIGDVHLGVGAHIRVTGKGRKMRSPTLTHETVAVIRAWLTELRGGQPDQPLFPTRQRPAAQPLHRRRDHHPTRHQRCRHLHDAASETHHTAHPAPYQRHAPARQQRRHRDDRAVARPRDDPNNAHLRARRPRPQGTSNRTNRPTRSQAGQIPRTRRTPGVPRSAVIMWNI